MVITKDIDKSVWIIFSIFTIFLFVVNVLFPTQSDSLGVPYGGIKAAINSYMTWNGRFFELVGIAWLHHLAPTIFFAFLNTFVGITFTIAFFYLIFGRLPKSYDDCVIIAIFILCVLYFSMFGSIFIWASGSLNYLWAYCSIVLVSLPYRIFWNQYLQASKSSFSINIQSFSTKIFLLAIFFIVSFCAGMSNEAGGLIAILIHFLVLLYAILYLKLKLPFWYILGIFVFVCGFLALYFSPGQAIRVNGLYESGSFLKIQDFLNMPLYDKLIKINKVYGYLTKSIITSLFSLGLLFFFYERFKNRKLQNCVIPIIFLLLIYLTKYISLFENFKYIISSCLFVLTYIYIYSLYKKECSDILARLYFYILVTFMLFYIIATSTLQVWLPDRARFFTILFGIAGYICLYNIALILIPHHIKKVSYVIFTICYLYMVFVLSAYVDMRLKWNNMVSYIEQQKSMGIEHVVVDKKYFHSFYKRYGDWVNPGNNAEIWPNTIYAKYFGVKTFVVK